jgi:hypothetical protein
MGVQRADIDELTISNPSSNLSTSTDKRGTWDLVSEDRSYPFDLGKSQGRFTNASYIIIESLAFKNITAGTDPIEKVWLLKMKLEGGIHPA